MQTASIQIANVSPGIFQLSTTGLMAAWILPVLSGVQQNLVPVYQLDPQKNVVPLAVDLGGSAQQVYVELFGTGIRNAKTVTVMAGSMSVPVPFFGPAPGFIGLDQLNIGPLPPALAGQGSINVVVTADGQSANIVNFAVK